MKDLNIKAVTIIAACIVLFGCTNKNGAKDPFSIVPPEKREQIRIVFKDDAEQVVLKNDLHAYRYWGGNTPEKGHYFYKRLYTNSSQAKRELSLPENNTAENVTFYTIPAGTVLIEGKASSLSGHPGYNNFAKGGGAQYYLIEPEKAQKTLVGKISEF